MHQVSDRETTGRTALMTVAEHTIADQLSPPPCMIQPIASCNPDNWYQGKVHPLSCSRNTAVPTNTHLPCGLVVRANHQLHPVGLKPVSLEKVDDVELVCIEWQALHLHHTVQVHVGVTLCKEQHVTEGSFVTTSTASEPGPAVQ